MLTEQIAFSKSTSKPIKANQPVNKQYEFGGVSTLVDGLKGNGNYKTGRWIAFYKNDMDVTIDLQQPTEISSVLVLKRATGYLMHVLSQLKYQMTIRLLQR